MGLIQYPTFFKFKLIQTINFSTKKMFPKTSMENGNRGRADLEDGSCGCSQSAHRVIQLRKVGGHLWFPLIVNFLFFKKSDFF